MYPRYGVECSTQTRYHRVPSFEHIFIDILHYAKSRDRFYAIAIDFWMRNEIVLNIKTAAIVTAAAAAAATSNTFVCNFALKLFWNSHQMIRICNMIRM